MSLATKQNQFDALEFFSVIYVRKFIGMLWQLWLLRARRRRCEWSYGATAQKRSRRRFWAPIMYSIDATIAIFALINHAHVVAVSPSDWKCIEKTRCGSLRMMDSMQFDQNNASLDTFPCKRPFWLVLCIGNYFKNCLLIAIELRLPLFQIRR